MLLFKKQFLPLIRSGQKRQTLRLWATPRLKVGQRTFAPGLGHLLITQVDVLPSFKSLTQEDAVLDGFASKRALLAEIRRIYGPPPYTRTLYRIQFQFPAPAGPKRQRPVADPALRATLRNHIVARNPFNRS